MAVINAAQRITSAPEPLSDMSAWSRAVVITARPPRMGIQMESESSMFFVRSCVAAALAQQQPGEEDEHARYHHEGVVIDVARLQTTHHA